MFSSACVCVGVGEWVPFSPFNAKEMPGCAKDAGARAREREMEKGGWVLDLLASRHATESPFRAT